MVPLWQTRSTRRLAAVWLALACVLASLFPAAPAVAQTTKPDLIPLVIPAGPQRVSPAPIPPLPRMAVEHQTVKPVDVTAAPVAQTVKEVIAIPDHAPAAPVATIPGAAGVVRATELSGLLPHTRDRHYFGLEAIQPGAAFAVTLIVEPAAALQKPGAVNFVVLTADGLERFLAGADPQAVEVATGSPMIFDQVGNRLTAVVPGSQAGGYTVIVYNDSPLPVTYALQVQGGLLRDDAGQTFAAVTVDAAAAGRRGETPTWTAPLHSLPQMETQVVVPDFAAPEQTDAPLALSVPERTDDAAVATLSAHWAEPVRARRLSGTLMGSQTQHFFMLAAEGPDAEIHLTLDLTHPMRHAGGGFWVLTQDGVRAMALGGLPQELNLATGLPDADVPGRYSTRLRLAGDVLYTVVLFHDGKLPTEYALTVEGGVLMDQYGQTNEASAAALEVSALGHN